MALRKYLRDSLAHDTKDHFCRVPEDHKNLIAWPKKLRENGIDFDIVFQDINELIITLPGAAHQGYAFDFSLYLPSLLPQ